MIVIAFGLFALLLSLFSAFTQERIPALRVMLLKTLTHPELENDSCCEGNG